MLNLSPVRLSGRVGVSLGRFQSCNFLEMDNFRLHGVEDEPKVLTAANGKRRRVYLRWATPFELFRELPGCENHLRPHITLAELDRFAQLQSDTEAALAMQSAKRKLFQSFESKRTA